MPLALAMPGAISSLVSRPLLGAALLCMLINAKWIHAFSEGDSCEIKDLSAAGQCMSASKCEPNLRKYISTGRLTIAQVPSCGLGPREEIICCPLVDCCPDDPRSSSPKAKELDEQSPYFDFQQLLNQNQNQNQIPKPNTQFFVEASTTPRSQPRPRQPKIVNRPPGRQSSRDLIQLVNDRLRHQGMNIEPAQRVTSFERLVEAPTSTTTKMPDPFAPFRFQAKEPADPNLDNLLNEIFGGSATTTRTISPTPTTRVDVPLITTVDRPAVVACRNYHSQLKIESLTPHILEGIPVAAGIYPHMAALAYNDFGSFDYRCGGSLISPRYVLTAAHCLNTATPVFVRLGAVNIEVPSMGYQDIKIVNFTIHPEYVSNSKYHDIALMELEHDATMNDFISPACLETNLSDPPLQSSLFVTGWGTMNQTTRERSKVLLRAPLDVVPLLQCNESIAEQPNGIRLLKQGVIDSLVCAADKRRQKADACSGDSGGPLIYERNLLDGNFTILGIISSGFGCATKTPGLYTRVASYLDFIEKIVWPNY